MANTPIKAESVATVAPTQETKRSFFDRLYTGEGAIDFIGRSKLWYTITLSLLAISLLAIGIRGFNLGIDFEGGTKLAMPAGDLVAEQVEETFIEATGVTPQLTQIVGAGESRVLEINSEHLAQDQIDAARQAIYEKYHPVTAEGSASADAIGDSTVSESWGSTITKRMLIAMGVFFVAAAIYMAVRLQRDMAIAAMVTLIADGLLILGIYALFAFEVTPAMIIGLLTVLTFNIYDKVIVFDKVKENTTGVTDSRRSTYAEEANLAINQTVMRSISTSVISALPIVALMVVAVWMLGVGTLRDLALIQIIGVFEGIASSLFLATPLLVTIVNRRKKYREHNAEVVRYRAGGDDTDTNSGTDTDTGTTRTVRTGTMAAGVPGEPTATATWRPNTR